MTEFEATADYKEFIELFLIIFAVVMILTGLWGIAAFKVDNKFFIAVYGLAVMVITVVMMGMAILFKELSNTSDTTMNSPCPNLSTLQDNYVSINANFEPLQKFVSTVKEIDNLNDLANYYMCSETCPCAQPSAETVNGWTDYQNWLETDDLDLNVYDRTGPADGEASVYSPLLFYEEGDESAAITFTTFKDCLTAVAEETWVPPDPAAIANLKTAVASETYPTAEKLAVYFSDYLDCSGYCYSALFAFSLPISHGR